MRWSSRPDSSERLVRWWLRGLVATVATAALLAAAGDARRGALLALAAVVGLLPFTYARRRLDRTVTSHLMAALGERSSLLRFVWTALGMACDALMVTQLLLARAPEPSPLLNASPIAWIGPFWFSGHALLVLGYGGLGLLRALRRWGRRVTAAPVPPALAPALSRRSFLRQASVLSAGVPFGVSLSGVGISYDFRVERRDVALPHWPPELDGMRIAHLSDIHVGGAMNRERLVRVAELTARERPDIVVHTGDFLTHRRGDFDAPLYEALSRIRAPYGQWACLGNHDYDDPERLVRRLRDAGVTSLRDQLATLEVSGRPLQIAGLEYRSPRVDRRVSYAQAVDGFASRGAAPRLLLNHDPEGFSSLPSGSADLVLSGHTHGGHIGVQLGPDHALTVVGMVGLRDQGLFERDDMRLYVTRCVGFYGYPMRIGIPPEIAILTLRRAA